MGGGLAERTWAVEGATGLRKLLAQELVAAGERVLEVPPKLAARVRLLEAGNTGKSDPNDARAVAVAALRSRAVRQARAGPGGKARADPAAELLAGLRRLDAQLRESKNKLAAPPRCRCPRASGRSGGCRSTATGGSATSVLSRLMCDTVANTVTSTSCGKCPAPCNCGT